MGWRVWNEVKLAWMSWSLFVESGEGRGRDGKLEFPCLYGDGIISEMFWRCKACWIEWNLTDSSFL
jgi:hypothetical protein